MPIWDYKCTECKHIERDVLAQYEEVPKGKVCPKCHKPTMEQLQGGYQTWFTLMGAEWSHSPASCNNIKV